MISRFAKSFVAIVVALLLLSTITFLHPTSRAYFDPSSGELFGEDGMEKSLRKQSPPIAGAEGGVIMSTLGNATANAWTSDLEIIVAWSWLDSNGFRSCRHRHTMTLRYPEKPTQDERDALSSYFHLLSRLYPCGECAHEFQELLRKYPPQTSSRRAASLWLCSVHNRVNERLHKEDFDCAHLDDTYDCGCGDEPIGTGPANNDLERNLDMMRGGR